jgi:hypothetical protein
MDLFLFGSFPQIFAGCPSQKLISGKFVEIRLPLHSDRKKLPAFRVIEKEAS